MSVIRVFNPLPTMLLLMLLILYLSSMNQPDAAKIDGPFVTQFVNDVSGSDIFKTTIGLTNVSKTTGLLQVCVMSSEAPNKVCHIVDASKQFSHDFGNATCPSCIITVGTFVFPMDNVPINSEVKACASKLEVRSSVCNHTVNTKERIPEDIIIELK